MSGHRRGRPACISPEAREKVVRMQIAGMGDQAIADELNQAGVSTPMGTCHWTRAHVWRLLRTRDATELLNRLRESPS
ncbi:hypothetical protein Aph01nite_03260 [Acrocarpospora phusangensis]|uniref:Recombinase domain-containing protein n=1 Tax=Acrocarpospora phusangensis TaxID=1070424 RepID=A0A919Q4K3_9ACTN|nr:hypothetical protein Aph01nite_03260 [Acrocarpospora phusangensis]